MLNLAGNDGTFTLVNKKTGTHRTFSIRTNGPDDRIPNKRVLALLTGPNNESDYTPFAFIDEGKVRPWQKYWDTKYEELGKFVYALSKAPNSNVDILFVARCSRCFRKLTTPDSILRGKGPECEKMG